MRTWFRDVMALDPDDFIRVSVLEWAADRPNQGGAVPASWFV
jgi:hypothetical protein